MQNKTYLFTGISALIHLSVFAAFSFQVSDIMPAEHGRSAINVEIVHTEDISLNNPESTSIKKTNLKKNNTEQTSSTVNEKTMTSVATKFTANSSNDQVNSKELKYSETVKKTENLKTAENKIHKPTKYKTDEIDTRQVVAVLQKELSNHFYYPKSAQRKNWQGIVILSFTILPNGKIEKIRINQSSGYDVLDSAAMNALAEINKQKELAIALNGQQLHQLLPVNYRLTN